MITSQELKHLQDKIDKDILYSPLKCNRSAWELEVWTSLSKNLEAARAVLVLEKQSENQTQLALWFDQLQPLKIDPCECKCGERCLPSDDSIEKEMD